MITRMTSNGELIDENGEYIAVEEFEEVDFTPYYLYLYDNTEDIIKKMKAKTPGSIQVIMLCLSSSLEGYDNLDRMTRLGIRGSNIYKLWNDCCEKDLIKMREVIMSASFGFEYTRDMLIKNLKQNRGTVINFKKGK